MSKIVKKVKSEFLGKSGSYILIMSEELLDESSMNSSGVEEFLASQGISSSPIRGGNDNNNDNNNDINGERFGGKDKDYNSDDNINITASEIDLIDVLGNDISKNSIDINNNDSEDEILFKQKDKSEGREVRGGGRRRRGGKKERGARSGATSRMLFVMLEGCVMLLLSLHSIRSCLCCPVILHLLLILYAYILCSSLRFSSAPRPRTIVPPVPPQH